jgi:hypothetical protein
VLVLQPNGVSAVRVELELEATLTWTAEWLTSLSLHRCKVGNEATHGK